MFSFDFDEHFENLEDQRVFSFVLVDSGLTLHIDKTARLLLPEFLGGGDVRLKNHGDFFFTLSFDDSVYINPLTLLVLQNYKFLSFPDDLVKLLDSYIDKILVERSRNHVYPNLKSRNLWTSLLDSLDEDALKLGYNLNNLGWSLMNCEFEGSVERVDWLLPYPLRFVAIHSRSLSKDISLIYEDHVGTFSGLNDYNTFSLRKGLVVNRFIHSKLDDWIKTRFIKLGRPSNDLSDFKKLDIYTSARKKAFGCGDLVLK